MRSDNREYLPRIDYLRGFAAWWVVAYHGVVVIPVLGVGHSMFVGTNNPFLLVASQGWIAVSLFTVVSGFSLARGLRGKNLTWRKYLAARWLRTAPLYLTLLIIGVFVPPGSSVSDPAAILATATMLPIPGIAEVGPWLGVAWSVRIELVLYVTLPILVAILARRPLIGLAGLAIIVVVVLAAQVSAGASLTDILYWGFLGRFIEFAAGAALGYLGTRALRARVAAVAGVLGLVGFVAASTIGNRAGGFFEVEGVLRVALFALCLVASLSLMIWASRRRDVGSSPLAGPLARARGAVLAGARAAAQSAGEWSYSTYMWHVPILILVVVPVAVFARNAGWNAGVASMTAFIALVILTGVVSAASYNLIERPFLRLRPIYARSDPGEIDSTTTTTTSAADSTPPASMSRGS
jgi:peptidoglycan/LPS O-acetylase OafA/YrhL